MCVLCAIFDCSRESKEFIFTCYSVEIGWGNTVEVELTRESGNSFGVCIVGGTVKKKLLKKCKKECLKLTVWYFLFLCLLLSLENGKMRSGEYFERCKANIGHFYQKYCIVKSS